MLERTPIEHLVADPLAALKGMAETRRQLAALAENGYERQLHERALAEYERRLQQSHWELSKRELDRCLAAVTV